MTLAVYIVGALLVLVGAVFIAIGVPVVRMEIGWSEVIGGAVAGSAGCVILAVGVVLTRLEELRAAVLGLNVDVGLRASLAEGEAEAAWAPAARAFAPHPLAPQATTGVEPEVTPEPALAEAPLHREGDDEAELPFLRPTTIPGPALAGGAPDLRVEEDMAPPLPPVEPVPADALTEPADEVPGARPPLPRPRPNFLAAFLARRSAAQAAAPRPLLPRDRADVEPPLMPMRGFDQGETPVRTPIDLSSGWDEPDPAHHGPAGVSDAEEAVPAAEAFAAHEPPPADEPEPEEVEAPAPEPLKPVVVGRYNAGSASYIMYSNGMIEVETSTGTHQFASMQDLKAFIERRDAAQV